MRVWLARVLIWVTYQHPANSLSYKCPWAVGPVIQGSEILPSDNSKLSWFAVNRQYDSRGLLSKEESGPVTNLGIHGDQFVRLVHEMTGSLCQGSWMFWLTLVRKGQIINIEWTIHKSILAQIFWFWDLTPPSPIFIRVALLWRLSFNQTPLWNLTEHFVTWNLLNCSFDYPHSNTQVMCLFILKKSWFCLELECCKPHKSACHPTKCDIINDIKIFLTVYRKDSSFEYPQHMS